MKDCCLAGRIEKTLVEILKKHSLHGKIKIIEIGDEPVACFGGLIAISHKNGRIQFDPKDCYRDVHND